MQSSHSCESTSVKHERDEGRGAEVKTFTPSPSFILALHASFHVLIYNSSLDHCRWDNGLSKLRLGSCCINHLKCYLGSGRITQFNSIQGDVYDFIDNLYNHGLSILGR